MFALLDGLNALLAHTTNLLLADVVWHSGGITLKIRRFANP